MKCDFFIPKTLRSWVRSLPFEQQGCISTRETFTRDTFMSRYISVNKLRSDLAPFTYLLFREFLSFMCVLSLNILPDLYAGDAQTLGLSIDHTYLRRLNSDDAGTVHVFLKNAGTREIGVTEVYLNGTILCNTNDKEAIWHSVVPNPIPPRRVGDLTIRLAYPITGRLIVKVRADDGTEVERRVESSNAPFQVTFIAFDEGNKKIHLYVQNKSDASLFLCHVYVNTQKVTNSVTNWTQIVPAFGKQCLTIKLSEPLIKGEYVSVKLTTTNHSISAEAVVKAGSYFPIVLENPKIGSYGMLLDEHVERRYYSQVLQTGLRRKTASNHGLRLIGLYIVCDECPWRSDWESFRMNTATILDRMAELNRRERPADLYFTYACFHRLEEWTLVLGQIADAFLLNPNNDQKHALMTRYFTEHAKLAWEPKPVHTLIVAQRILGYDIESQFFFTERTPEPDEVRLMTYNSIVGGSKGIIFRVNQQTLQEHSDLVAEMKAIVGELQVLKRFLKVSEPMSLAETSEPSIEANTVLAGDKGIVLILINKQCSSAKSVEKAFDYQPFEEDFEVTVLVPKWMTVRDVYEVGGRYERLKYELRPDGSILIRFHGINLTRQVVLATDEDAYFFDSDGDLISDIQEVSLFDTHPYENAVAHGGRK